MSQRILIADDDEAHLALVAELLKTKGYQTFAARDGEEAVREATRLKPDLVIMDVQMPRMDGDQAAMILKAAPETKSIPILFLTALRSKEEIQEAGEDDILAKPVPLQLLLDRVAAMASGGLL